MEDDTSSSRPIEKGEGEDDERFMMLVHEYKLARRRLSPKESEEKLEEIFELGIKGDVSDKVKTGVAY